MSVLLSALEGSQMSGRCLHVGQMPHDYDMPVSGTGAGVSWSHLTSGNHDCKPRRRNQAWRGSGVIARLPPAPCLGGGGGGGAAGRPMQERCPSKFSFFASAPTSRG